MNELTSQNILSYDIISFDNSDLLSLESSLSQIESSNGSGFLCCSSIYIDEGFIGISIPF